MLDFYRLSCSDAKIPLLNTVKEFQADHVENTCLIREDLESRIVENRTNKVIKKKVKGKEPPISVQPGEGKVHFFFNQIQIVSISLTLISFS